MSVIEQVPTTELDEPVVLNEVQHTLLSAERWMREHGWANHANGVPSGPGCLIQSYLRADRYSGAVYNQARLYILEAIWEKQDACRTRDISVWNDNECRDEEEALSVLRRARELAG